MDGYVHQVTSNELESEMEAKFLRVRIKALSCPRPNAALSAVGVHQVGLIPFIRGIFI